MTGPLVKELVEHLRAYAQSKLTPPNRKLFMYSAHDVPVATFLSALNIFNGIQPPYASMVLVELHELKPNDFSVKVNLKSIGTFLYHSKFHATFKLDFVQERVG